MEGERVNAHIPALLDEVLTWMHPRTGGLYIDGTLGAGGHARAILEASAGEVGELLLQRGHAREVGGASVIGRATATGEPVIAFDTDEDSLHFENELLPDTRSEMAIPLKLADEVVGADPLAPAGDPASRRHDLPGRHVRYAGGRRPACDL